MPFVSRFVFSALLKAAIGIRKFNTQFPELDTIHSIFELASVGVIEPCDAECFDEDSPFGCGHNSPKCRPLSITTSTKLLGAITHTHKNAILLNHRRLTYRRKCRQNEKATRALWLRKGATATSRIVCITRARLSTVPLFSTARTTRL